MGTRNLTMVVLNGATKIAQYGQWDGYPSGQGTIILTFLKKIMTEGKEQEFRDAVSRCFFFDNAELSKLNAKWRSDMAAIDHLKSYDVVDAAKLHAIRRQADNLCYLSRDVGGQILDIVMAKPEARLGLVDESSFARDSSCEWAYVIDLDSRELEVYNGYAETAPAEHQRFASPDDPVGPFGPDVVQLVGKVSLDDLPDDMSQFEPKDEKEEAA